MNATKAILFGIAVLIGYAPLAARAGICTDSGGTFQCEGPIAKSEWSYMACDDAAASIARSVTWCNVLNGTWSGGPNPVCIGFERIDANNAEGKLRQFENDFHNSCSTIASGASSCSNVNCNCADAYYGGIQVRKNTINSYTGMTVSSGCAQSWLEIGVITAVRDAGCPDGLWAEVDDGKHVCIKYPCVECELRLGNPIDSGSGAKMQREIDFESASPGGLAFVRYYNSAGFFVIDARDPAPSDYWRHNYAGYIIPYPANAYVMAAVMRPDGAVRSFNPSGVEMLNSDGAAYRLQKLVDGGGVVTGWKITTPDSDVETYNAQGRLSSIATRSGFVTTLAYNGSGQLATISDAFGRSITLAYDSSGQLSSMTDPSSRVYQYTYDDKGRMSAATYPDTRTRTYVYEDALRKFGLTGIIDERGARLSTYGYDANGRANLTERAGSENRFTLSWSEWPGPTGSIITTATDAFGTDRYYSYSKVNGTLKLTKIQRHIANGITENEQTRTYDASGNLATIVDAKGITTSYVFDATRNLETSRTEAYGTYLARTITRTWHPTYRLPATITEPSGVAGVNLVTTFTYDLAGNLTKKNLTAGAKVREWNYTYNARGQVLTVDGPRTDVTDGTAMVYYGDTDACVGCRGQVYTATNAAGHVTTFNAYNLDGRPTQITDANGVVSTFTYKPRGWLESRSVAGETTTYDYDYVGNLAKVTLPDASWLAYSYDAANGLVSIDDSMGNAIDYALDVMGNRVQEYVYDPANVLRRTSQQVFDGLNRLDQQLGAIGQTTRYTYDLRGAVETVTDPLGRVTTTNTYDFLGRLTNVRDAANGNTVFTYDTKDRLATVKDPKISATTNYTYDGLGNLLTQDSPDTGATTFTYDNAGNVATQTDARGTATTYSYDALNRVTAATVTDGTVGYEYDNLVTGGAYAKGRLTKVTDPSGNTTYAYDSLGRTTSKTQTTTATPSNKTFTVGYSYASGRQTGITYPSGRAITYGFNAAGQVTSILVDGSVSVLGSALYMPFGPAKQWTWGNGEAVLRGFDLDGRTRTYTLGPAAGTYADVNQTFGYDVMNRLASANLAAGQTLSYTFDANGNRTNATVNAASTAYTYPSTSHKLASLSGATTRSFSYDNAGNTTSSAGITYAYDGRGRMKLAGTTSYLVNGLGQRVKKSGATDTYFAYDEAGRLIGEYDSTGTATQETVWLGDLPVAILKPKTPSGFDVFYIWADHLGTPRQITDVSNQSRWEWSHNDPFGNNAPNENPSALGTFTYNLRFPGQYYDSETGKHYNNFRDYDPGIGRYVQSDPIGLRGGLNTYGYVRGSPLRLVDPLGLRAQMCCKRIPWTPFAHCFINEEKDKDKSCENGNCPSQTRRLGLQGPWPLGSSSNGAGEIHTNDGFDQPGESKCGEWTSYCGLSRCLDQVKDQYPPRSEYNALDGPNSNTFATHLANMCSIPFSSGPWSTPGWNQPPAGPAK